VPLTHGCPEQVVHTGAAPPPGPLSNVVVAACLCPAQLWIIPKALILFALGVVEGARNKEGVQLKARGSPEGPFKSYMIEQPRLGRSATSSSPRA
jgi:hypothetical protein